MPCSSNDGGRRPCASSLFFDLLVLEIAQIVERADNVLNFKEKARDNGWNEISVLIDEVVTYI
jgi:hypothetical protein